MGPPYVALLLNSSRGVYSSDVIQAVIHTTQQSAYLYGGIVNPREFKSDALFAQEIEQYEVIISEIRPPYVPFDILASVHNRCIPTIRICHLDEHEAPEQAAKELHLSYNEESWLEDKDDKWPSILSGYQLDGGMKPVIFWRTIDQLVPEVVAQLEKVKTSREELVTLGDARKYFLSIGRRDEEVFISNANSQNNLGMSLRQRLEELGIRGFHYTDLGAIPVGSPDWLEEVYQKIDNAAIFVALLNQDYTDSEWCQKEIDYALPRYNRGEMIIYPYIVEKMEWPESKLHRIEGTDLMPRPHDTWLDIIVHDIVKRLESPSERRFEVRFFYNDHSSRLGTFRNIENGQLKSITSTEQRLNVELLDASRAAGADYPDWARLVTSIGKTLFSEILTSNALTRVRYDEVLQSAGFQKKVVRFCFATDPAGFVVPFEWLLTNDKGFPVCLEHPTRRFLTGCSSPRAPLNTLQRRDIRVLLVSSNTGHIRHVDEEVDYLEKYFIEHIGLQSHNICKLNTPEATTERLKHEIVEGEYHILHFAGHGGCDDEKGPYIQVWKDSSQTEVEEITPVTLNEWMTNTELRFVYMSNCQSADMNVMGDQPTAKLKFRPLRGIVQAIVEARVPEVIGFHWPIMDNDSYKMAQVFYEHYAASFDSALALYEARKSFANRDSQIWAAPILIQQF